MTKKYMFVRIDYDDDDFNVGILKNSISDFFPNSNNLTISHFDTEYYNEEQAGYINNTINDNPI